MGRRRLTKAERERVYRKCNGRCAYCGCVINYKDMQVNHAIPLRKGGSDTLNNMLPACRSCNHYKSTFTVNEFRTYVSGIPERLQRDSIPYQVWGRIQSCKNVQFYFEKEADEKLYY